MTNRRPYRCELCRRRVNTAKHAELSSFWCVRCALWEVGVDRSLFGDRAIKRVLNAEARMLLAEENAA